MGSTGDGPQAGGIAQLILPDGSPNPNSGFDPSVLDDRLAELYTTMVVTRGLDEEYVNLQRQGQLALFPSCRGQEAAQIGCAAALRPDDWLFPQYRELGIFLVRGVAPGDIGLAWRGTWHGGLGFVEHCVAPMSIPIGTQALHAVGAAMASSWLGDQSLAVAFIGDGATSEGDVHEAMNLAAVRGAPCIFFIQNNGWAISTPVSEQCRAPLVDRASGYGMPGVQVDGNDIVACFTVVAEAASRARSGGGPTLIDAVTYRMGPHTTSDDPTRYRDAEEVDLWAQRDPILRTQRHLQRIGGWSEALGASAEERARSMRADLRAVVVDAPDGDPLEVFDHVYVEPPLSLLAQRTELAIELGSTP
jgi:pyruvate dehydrogenase E1 component alpha subunit